MKVVFQTWERLELFKHVVERNLEVYDIEKDAIWVYDMGSSEIVRNEKRTFCNLMGLKYLESDRQISVTNGLKWILNSFRNEDYIIVNEDDCELKSTDPVDNFKSIINELEDKRNMKIGLIYGDFLGCGQDFLEDTSEAFGISVYSADAIKAIRSFNRNIILLKSYLRERGLLVGMTNRVRFNHLCDFVSDKNKWTEIYQEYRKRRRFL